MTIADAHILGTFKQSSTKEEGFRLLVDKYQERLYWQIRRMVHNHEDADDILQNTFIKVWKYLDSFKEQSQLHTWLYRVAMNETLNFLKKQQKHTTTDYDDVAHELSENTHSDEYFTADEIQLKLQGAIATLPEKQKIVFNLRYYDEMSYEEMSQVLETSVGALKASYHHAVKKVEHFLTSG